MSSASPIAGSQPPQNRVAAATYVAQAAADEDHPRSYPVGTPVSAVHGGARRTVVPSQADAEGPVNVAGLCVTPGVVGGAVKVQTDGVVHLTTDQWDEITGGTGGLALGTTYYLATGPTSGLLTDTPPSGRDEFVTQVGVGLSPTDLMVQICCADPTS